MISPFAILFIALQQRIKEKVPSIRWIDQNLGQLESAERPPVSFPCVLIDFDEWNFEDLSELVQTAAGNIIIRLAFAPFSAINNVTPTAYKLKALQFYEIECQLYKALHGWAPSLTAEMLSDFSNDVNDDFGGMQGLLEDAEGWNFGSLIRTAAITEKREDLFRVRVMPFSLAFEDYSAMRETTTTEAELELIAQIIE